MKSLNKHSNSQATLEGCLERITYHNSANQFTVAKLKVANSPTPVTIVGHLAGVSPGEGLKVNGQWHAHVRFGQQFKIESYEVTLPASSDGIRIYLQSGVVKGIGPSMAKKMVDVFGAETLDIIENNPDRLLEIDGIGEAKAELICSAWKDHHAIRGLMQFLQEMGVNASFCSKIYAEYGPDSVDLIRQDPYRLADDFPGEGFFIADSIAPKLGVDVNAAERARACILHMIYQICDDGHSFAEEENLLSRCEHQFQIERHQLERAIDELVAAESIVVEPYSGEVDTRIIYLSDLYLAEVGLATRLRALTSVPLSPPNIDADRILSEVQKKLAVTLSAEQLSVLEQIFVHRMAIITGGPGTGKTTLLRSISTVFEAMGKQVSLAAPTGRAARRLAEMTARNAKTIHRLLGYNFTDGGFIRNRDNPLDADAIIIDEASMVDIFLMYHFLNAVPATAVIVFVGDVFQLPSVGPGNVLADMINSQQIPVFYLNKIFRQAQESPIILNAHSVRRGESLDLDTANELNDHSEFIFIRENDPGSVVDKIVQLCSDGIPGCFGFDPIQEVQVLTPMHKGLVGTINLNQVLQKVLNPNPVQVEAMGNTFRLGDKVMQIRNNYQKEVFNGDIGVITAVDSANSKISVNYYGRPVEYNLNEMDELTIAYAISVHKSQGSEYPAVVIPLMTQHYILLQRNLLYTALTRGQKLVVLIGMQKALSVALRNDKPQNRLSRLAERLQNYQAL